MTDTQPPATWDYDYTPYTLQHPDETHPDCELPHYRIYAESAPDIWIAETNEDLPRDVQESHARLISAAPDLLHELRKLVHDGEREAAEAGEAETPWLDDARAAIKRAAGGVL